MATRPAPGRPPAPPSRPAPGRPPAPPSRPAPGRPPAPQAPKPQAPKAPTPPAPNRPTTKARPPKPTGNPGPGRAWVYKASSNSWVAERKTMSSPTPPAAGTAPATGADTGADTGAEPVSSKTADEIAADITKGAQSQVAMRDPALAGRYTTQTKGLGGLGFGFSKADGSLATYDDIFGSLAPGASVDRNSFGVRDALGREINTDLLGSDVYGGKAATDIAGTALGNAIVQSRRAGARDAEERSASGIMGGGFRTAAGEVQKQQQGAEITGLLGKLSDLEGEITGTRTQTFQNALETAAGGDIGRYAPEPSPRADVTAPTATTPAAGRTSLTAGPTGTFMKETNAARASGTPAQKITKLNALLNNPKYNMSALQKRAIKQMITDIQKKKK